MACSALIVLLLYFSDSLNKAAPKWNVEGNLRQVFEKVRKCQKEITDFRNMCDRDIFEIEKGFAKAVAPHIHNRSALIAKIPNFWSNVLLHHPLLTTVFEPGEKDIFKYLTKVEIEDVDDNPDYFKIHFHFDPNPYFENRILTKQFTDGGSANTTIKWKSNQVFPKSSKHDVWEYDELGLEMKGFFRWFCDPEEQFCDPIADILKCHVWYDPTEFYFEDPVENLLKDSAKIPPR